MVSLTYCKESDIILLAWKTLLSITKTCLFALFRNTLTYYWFSFFLGECNHPCLQIAECTDIRKNNVCYYLFDRNSLNWEGNEKFCVDKGMKMLQTSGRNVGIVSKLRYNSTNFNYDGVWLGGEAVNFEKWTFLNSTDVGKITGLILQGRHCFLSVTHIKAWLCMSSWNKTFYL